MFNVVSPLFVHVVWMSRSGMKTTFPLSKYKFGSLEPFKGINASGLAIHYYSDFPENGNELILDIRATVT